MSVPTFDNFELGYIVRSAKFNYVFFKGCAPIQERELSGIEAMVKLITSPQANRNTMPRKKSKVQN